MDAKNGLPTVFKKIFFLGLFCAWSLTAWSQSPEIEKAMAEGNHKVLADYYRTQAQVLKGEAAQHEKMGKLYQKNHEHYKDFTQTMAHHCENLRLQALQASYQYEVLAREEEKLAKTKK